MLELQGVQIDINQLFEDLNRLIAHPLIRQIVYHWVQEQKLRFRDELKQLDAFPIFREERIIPINYKELVPADAPSKVKTYFKCVLNHDWLRDLVLDKFYDCYLPLYEEQLITT